MKILRRRRVILVFLVLIWVGGMAYFLTNLSTKDESLAQDNQGDSIDSNEDFLLREKQEHRQTREYRKEKEEILVSIFDNIQI